MRSNELERWLIARTELIITARQIRQKGLSIMPMELKGLKGKALKVAANLDRLNLAYDNFNAAAPLHAADVEGLTPQITSLQDDLTFATQVLGNSVNGSNAGVDPPKTDIVSPQPGSVASIDPGNGDAPERNVFNG